MTHILGISAGFHDAAVTLLSRQGDIEFAGHSERYSKIKHDSRISAGLLAEISGYAIDTVAYYERPWAKQLMRLYSGQGVQSDSLLLRQVLKQHLPGMNLAKKKLQGFRHHLCHAAAGFQTSPFDQATVVVIDAIGELDTITIWQAKYVNGQAKYELQWRQHYPHSIGLFYSAVTDRVGLKPLDEEYILMGMAAFGKDIGLASSMKRSLITDEWAVTFRENLHTGLYPGFLEDYNDFDIAKGAQILTENLITNVMRRAQNLKYSKNLVYMGGVALNCVANSKLGEYFDETWIMPCPGDAGSSLGAAALAHGGKINWKSAYLGHCIGGSYPVNTVLDELVTGKICGVASGRAEFGPRALGNRSLLADPRGIEIKDRVNAIKRRQQFRPFAPAILEEHVHSYFDMPRGWHHSRYMQTVAGCRHPELFPAIIHHDGTSRVQTVPQDGSGLRELLEKWFVITGCPMLLNTSLNIRGEPMVNDRADADRFEQLYGIKVCS